MNILIARKYDRIMMNPVVLLIFTEPGESGSRRTK